MEIIDDVPFDEARKKVEAGEYLLIVDRALATQAFGSSGSIWTNLVFAPYVGTAAGIVLLFFDWRIGLLAFFLAILSFRLLRSAAITWVRRRALSDRTLYDVFAKHRIVWFTPSHRTSGR